jgi:sigma-B regulation protein RsbU (phosphoserine phosphatase)
MVRFSLRALARTDASPRSVLEKLNVALLAEAEKDVEDERFCTAVFGVLTPGPATSIVLAGGGHPPPLVRRADGSVVEVAVGGSPLGLFHHAGFGSASVTLRPGDTLVLYTDGLTEARRDGVQFGGEGLRAAVAAAPVGAAPLALAIERAVLDHTGGVVGDDVAALVIHHTKEGAAAPD